MVTTSSEIKDASDKMQAGATAAGNKMKDPDRDADFEYNKEQKRRSIGRL